MKKLFLSGLTLFLVCFLLACVAWFGFEKQNNQLNSVDKEVNDKNIVNLNIDSQNSEVQVKQGDEFSVTYKGKKNIDITHKNKTLHVHETDNTDDHYGLNFNPFRQFDDEMVVTVPDKKLNHLNVSSKTNIINIDSINVKDAYISMKATGAARVFLSNVALDKLYYRGLNSPIDIKRSQITNANIKTKQASITSKKSLIEKSVLLADHGKIDLSRMDIASHFRASTQYGDIFMSYNEDPQDTLLRLNPSDGTSEVINNNFEDNKVGSGKHILEFYTDHGDIYIN
ncbi:DUF4097 family beta strand repeat-containing protein [Staphylococcus equorum]|uniref:DUF4097 family beta strand repeat-containing protein n=1 Tax=Staphylococcus equorum TaxID=246432 RepID=UPI003F7AB0C7